MIKMNPLVDGDPELPDHLRPLRDIRSQECGELLRRVARELDALAARALLELRQVQDSPRLRVELRDASLRRPGRRDQTVPGVDVDGIAELGEGGNVRGERRTPGARHGESGQLARLHMR